MLRRLLLCATFALPVVNAVAWAGAADHVIQISVDGLRPDLLQTLIDRGDAPNFQRFQSEGAWTNNARTDATDATTLPNHTTMLTGRPVSRPPGMPSQTEHGWDVNAGPPPPTLTLHNHTTPEYYKASTFDMAHDAGLSTALFVSKHKFVIYDQSYDETNGADHANGRDKIDTYGGHNNILTMQRQLLDELGDNRFNYTFVHYDYPDHAGHQYGWGSDGWNESVVWVDGYLGELFDLIENDPVLNGVTTIVLSADHGGTGNSHSDLTKVTNYRTPFYAWGAGVGRGDLYAMNDLTRVDPLEAHPGYDAIGQPIRNGDGANLALSLLGLGPIPGSLINASQELRLAIPEPASIGLLIVAAGLGATRRPPTRRRQ
ncbi:alkaline phosphatase family protein [Pseudobythopirellula maris]|uniref:alkaline phosphatase family protein n=1 Tax=Pseudobythopirellula maris TaxID=2527991 RepID=UPI0018D2BED5|nr:alkaline phosphatase family protein [Pseudobythopirellula maris]